MATRLVEQDGPINAIIYGDSGTGKTTLAASAHMVDEMADVLFIDTENSTQSVAWVKNSKGEPVLVEYINNTKQFDVLKAQLSLPVERRPEELRNVKTVVIDSVDMVRDDIIAQKALHDSKAGYGQPEQRHYLQVTNELLFWYFQLAQIRPALNVFMITHQKESANGMQLLPNLNDKLATNYRNLVSYTWYCDSVRGQRRVYLTSDARADIVTKNRNPDFVDRVIKYTMEQAPDPDQAQMYKGVLVIPDREFPTMKIIHDLIKGK